VPSILGYNQWRRNYWDDALVKQWDWICQRSTKEQTLTTYNLVFHLWKAPQDLVHACWTSDKKELSYS
jgi:hypothetical protein